MAETSSETHAATHTASGMETIAGGMPNVPHTPRNIIVGVCGGIAAYKSCQIIRDFGEAGDHVRVIPTNSALRFVGAATFEALSGNPVSTTVFDDVDEVAHVRLGQEADGIVIAPATADFLARVAGGRADDLLAATVLVATCPVVIAPAMHTEMWNNPATQANVATLRERGIVVLNPAVGRLTGTDSGAGRLPEPAHIAEIARTVFSGVCMDHNLDGVNVLISAGGTQEIIDPVRFIGNRSSGRQGFALADIALHRGANVTLVAANNSTLPHPPGATVIPVETTQELQQAMHNHAEGADVIIMAAAVSDFRPAKAAEFKMKKSHGDSALHQLEMTENPDVLAGLVAARAQGTLSANTVIMGFAAETGDDSGSILEYARQKLERKGCDLLLCNEVGPGKVFGQATNQGFLLDADGGVAEVAAGTKHVVAAQILDKVAVQL